MISSQIRSLGTLASSALVVDEATQPTEPEVLVPLDFTLDLSWLTPGILAAFNTHNS